MKNLYWVGSRLSDILNIESMFCGAVVLYGKKQDKRDFYCNPMCVQTGIRVNHNDVTDNRIAAFYKEETDTILDRDPNAFFLWYAVKPLKNCSDRVKSHSICFNSSELYQLFSDKLRCRLWIADYLDVLGTTVITPSGSLYNEICELFPSGNGKFVVQQISDIAGGFGTFLLDEVNQEELCMHLHNSRYLVSPYLADAISVNQHVVLYENETVLFPGSIQLLQNNDNKLQYCGGDFAAYNELSSVTIETINANSKKIGDLARAIQYRGVMGIDYIVTADGQVLFVEINSRFQGSTLALNYILRLHQLPSIQEYHLEAFQKLIPSVEPTNIIDRNYSIVNFSNSINYNVFDLKRRFTLYSTQPSINIIDEGELCETTPTSENALMFRILVHSNVSSVSKRGVILHPNIFQRNLGSLSYNSDFISMSRLKIGLLTHGLRIDLHSEKALDERLKQAVNKGFDLIFNNNWYINACTDSKYVTLSPFVIVWKTENIFKLYYNEQYVTDITIDYKDKLANQLTTSGVLFYDIAQFFTDRLRIHPFPRCSYGSEHNKACRFCEEGNGLIPVTDYGQQEVHEVVEAYLQTDLPIVHFLIGGGTSLQPDSWQRIIELVRFIRTRTKRSIYVMTIPPSVDIVQQLYDAGVSEIGFNIELYNRNYAVEYMPAKGHIPLETYFNALDKAVSLWGNNGNVRSLLMAGLESDSDTLDGVEALCMRGIMPILSVFRPMYGTPMEHIIPPDFDTIWRIWESSVQICRRYGLMPGPACIACQNNTLSLPFNIISRYYNLDH